MSGIFAGLLAGGGPTNDQYFPYTSLLLSTTALGNANNNLFVDSSGAFNPISRNGNTTQGSFSPYATNWSNYFDGSGDYFTVPYTSANFDWWSTDFTIEYWFFANSSTGISYLDAGINHSTVVGNRSATSTTDYWSFGPTSAGTVTFYYYNGGGNGVTSTATYNLNTWNHVAMTKTSSGITIFVNGVAGTTTAISGTPQSSAGTPLTIGQGNNSSFNGYVSNLRIVRGTAIYSGNFTVPTAPLTAVTNTTLLTCQSNRFRDASSNNFAITAAGNTAVTEFGPFSPAYPGLVYNQNDIQYWSGYFDGSGDYLTSPDNAAVQFGSGDFTIEMWVYFSTTSGTQVLLGSRANTGVFAPYQFYYTSGVLYLYGSTNGSSWNIFNGLTVIPSVAAGQWYHVAIVRSGSNFSTYSNGVRQSNTTVSGSLLASSAPVTIGSDAGGASPYNGYISNLRMVKGTAVYDPSQSTLTVPTSPLTAVTNTSLLTCQNAAFTDNSTNNFPITINGNTTVTGNNPFQAGYYSNYFDGSGDYIALPNSSGFQYGTGDFCTEAWVYMTSLSPSSSPVIATSGNTGGAGGTYIGVMSNGNIEFFDYVATTRVANGGTITTNKWFHIAVTRSGTTLRIFQDGVQVASGTCSSNFTGSASGGGIATWVTNNTGLYFNGYISNLRVVKGSAVYTSNFTPSTAPLTAISGTSLLTCQSARFIDTSTNTLTTTPNGDTKVQTFNPFFVGTTPASNGGSMYFDGSGDWLQAPRAANLLPGTNDFTIEAWVYPTTTGTTQFIMGFLEQGTSGDWSMFRHTNDTLGFYTQAGGDTFGGVISRNQWNHIALSRVSGTLYKCVNGSATSVAWTSTLNSNLGYNLTIGADNAGDEIFFTGWMYGARIINGTGLYSSSTYTVPTTPFTPTAATTLLVNGMNAGAYDATGINDMETVGDAKVSTAVSKFGGSSMAFDGTGDYLTTPTSPQFNFGTGDFTVECWFKSSVSSQNTHAALVACYASSTNGTWAFKANSGTSGYIEFASYTNNTWYDWVTTTNVSSDQQWHHCAVTRSGTTLRIFVDGVVAGTWTGINNNFTGAGHPLTVGFMAQDSTSYLTGYIDDLRVTKGVARYTANFTPPTAAFPTY